MAKSLGSVTFIPEVSKYVAAFLGGKKEGRVVVDIASTRTTDSLEAAVASARREIGVEKLYAREVASGRMWELIDEPPAVATQPAKQSKNATA